MPPGAETSELIAFTKTVDAKSLSRAAAELGVPRATLSRRIAQLEKKLGTRLLLRTTRSLALTEPGAVFYKEAIIALEAIKQAEQSVSRSGDCLRGDLRVSLPPGMKKSFRTMLCEFIAQHPLLRVHVHTSSHHIDFRSGGFDVALRASSQMQPGLIARTLFRDPVIAVASPDYLSGKGVPVTLDDLSAHQCLMGFARGELPEMYWPLLSGERIKVDGAFFSDDISLLCEAAINNRGIALLPEELIGEHLQQGALVPVLRGIIGTEMQIAVVYPDRHFLLPQVRAFIEAVVSWVASEREQQQRRIG
ncbi:LysR family transcriptional regulator [Cronobacter muytjensii]|uniref:LysR family transcriptional regulator n=1 Tax=Cronobacter muytjensii TaxID=413501 RepID=UPI000577B21A|nr:LysR family transcriptional regulator [Cronobacter muytjensii]ALB70997.1 LysR family transcriptional regulator [Cronobacter muytjensii ATCC 51329]ELY2497713.1 LysR family transcriptional regulator [Cronobacter muytjensii]ELY6273285.1 LysR family transcriptional regulator [Cronobacter muytjensii]MEB8639411.1 LysR family transcriptional regulator [Cronobacter muytjensii]